MSNRLFLSAAFMVFGSSGGKDLYFSEAIESKHVSRLPRRRGRLHLRKAFKM